MPDYIDIDRIKREVENMSTESGKTCVDCQIVWAGERYESGYQVVKPCAMHDGSIAEELAKERETPICDAHADLWFCSRPSIIGCPFCRNADLQAQVEELVKDVHALAVAANIARPDAQIGGPMALMLLYDVQKLMVEQREQNTKLREACAAAHDWLWDREREEALVKLRKALEDK